MIILTKKEREALLILFKEFSSYYNANSLSKKIGISHVGAQKILKKFKEEGLTVTKRVGKSIIHKSKIDDDYNKVLDLLNAGRLNLGRNLLNTDNQIKNEYRLPCLNLNLNLNL